jgi:hypothetical protein
MKSTIELVIGICCKCKTLVTTESEQKLYPENLNFLHKLMRVGAIKKKVLKNIKKETHTFFFL